MSSLMGEAVGKREGEGKLRDGDMRGAGREGRGRRGERGREQDLLQGFLSVENCFLHA